MPNTRFSDKPPVVVGCAGWSLSSRTASFFPEQGTHLERYAQVFGAVEINSSFYREHQAKTYARWAASVPEAFRFSVKVPRTITHERRLRDVGDLLSRLADQLAGLGEKLGCLLVQLPPSLALDPWCAEAFFADLRVRIDAPMVCEPRHTSWFSAAAQTLLRQWAVDYVLADPVPVSGVQAPDPNHIAYMRLHGAPVMYYSSYDDAFIAQRAAEALALAQMGRQVWCMFDNTAQGAAIPNALTLMSRLKDG